MQEPTCRLYYSDSRTSLRCERWPHLDSQSLYDDIILCVISCTVQISPGIEWTIDDTSGKSVRIRIKYIDQTQHTVSIRCPIKKCCKRLSQLSETTGNEIPLFCNTTSSSTISSSAALWLKWSESSQDWLPISTSTKSNHFSISRHGRLTVAVKDSTDLARLYQCMPSPESQLKSCRSRITRVVLKDTHAEQVAETSPPISSNHPTVASVPSPTSPLLSQLVTSNSPPPMPPTIRTPDQLELVSAGSTFTLKCDAVGFPKPTIRWLRGYRQINFRKESRLSQLANGSLRFSPVSTADRGVYRCVADNEHGRAFSTNEIFVR